MHKITLFVIAFVAMVPNTLNAQVTAHGTVFLDSNKNGKIDRGEKRLSGVGVSNGDEVVLTDGKGRYAINIDEDATIFVIKPANYLLPVNGLNQP